MGRQRSRSLRCVHDVDHEAPSCWFAFCFTDERVDGSCVDDADLNVDNDLDHAELVVVTIVNDGDHRRWCRTFA